MSSVSGRTRSASNRARGTVASVARSSASTSSSAKTREAARRRIEYEAAQEEAAERLKVVQAKRAMELAELDAEEEEEEQSVVNAASERAKQWIEALPFSQTVVQSQGPPDNLGCVKPTGAECIVQPQQGGVMEPFPRAEDEFCTPAGNDKREVKRTCHHLSAQERVVSGSRVRWPDTLGVPQAFPETPVAGKWPGKNDMPSNQDRHSVPTEPPRPPDDSGAHHRVMEELSEMLGNMPQRRKPPLPKAFYELPVFTGGSTDWLFFKQRYDDTCSTWHYSNQENMFRLQVALQGQARALVEDLIRTSTEPGEVMAALDRSYGSPDALLNSAITKVCNLNSLKDNDSGGLRLFSASVRSCVSVLKNIHAESNINNPQLFKELIEKLTPAQRTEYGRFAKAKSSEMGVDLRIAPSLTILVDFLEELADAACFVNTPELAISTPTSAAKWGQRGKMSAPSTRPAHKVHVVTQPPRDAPSVCTLCKGQHKLVVCGKFLSLDVDERWAHVKEEKLCFKCVIGKHNKMSCRAKRCTKCGFPHNVLLHKIKPSSTTNDNSRPIPEQAPSPTDDTAPSGTTTPLPVNYQRLNQRSGGYLKIVPISFYNGNIKCETYALLDDGASVSIIDQELVSNINGKMEPLHYVSANGQVTTVERSKVINLAISGSNGETHVAGLRTVPDFHLTPQTISAQLLESCPHLRGLPGTELRDAVPRVLLGQDNWQLIIGQDISRGKSGFPVASLTALGWVVHGTKPPRAGAEYDSVFNMNNLDEMIKYQFDLDALGVSAVPRSDPLKQRAMKILDETSKFKNGHWHVGLLWNKDDVSLPDNYKGAESRLLNIERKMDKDNLYAEMYNAQIDRLVDNGYAQKLDKPIEGPCAWFLPHFGVYNVNKPGKLRLVYDASAPFRGTCLNDHLMSGPDLLNSLLGILFRFRAKQVALMADIADMFLRIKIAEKDQAAQMFLWRGNNRSHPPSTYVMSSMLFGAASSPATAIYILNKNAERFIHEYPEAVEAVKRRHYMDDYVDSVDDAATAIAMIRNLTCIHAAGNFNIRGWVSNDPQVRATLEPAEASVDMTKLGGNSVERTLGMIWDPHADTLSFDISLKKLRPEVVDGSAVPTKREFLRAIMSIYDPIGLLCPITVESRILMQRIWRSNIEWDNELNDDCFRGWLDWLQQLECAKNMYVPRWYKLDGALTMHVFGDAGEQAYAAVVYLVDDNYNVALVAAKARVAPLKVISIPRLELQAAVLACRLARTVITEIELDIKDTVYWTDSKTVLSWIRSDPRDYKPFVSHRLAEIESLTNATQWHWVPSELNPADECTRPGWNYVKSQWLSGPSFIAGPAAAWPPERRGEPTVALEDVETEKKVHAVNVISTPPPQLLDIERFSSWEKATRTLARVLAFISGTRKLRTSVTAELVAAAELLLIGQSQQRCFANEIRTLQKGCPVDRGSRLLKIDPMLGEDGLLRVRGRLTNAETSYQVKHPFILDGDDKVTRLLLARYHALAGHAHRETVVNEIRSKYYVTRLRRAVSSVAAACQFCRVLRAQPTPPKMADLPEGRLQHHQPAFSHCGLDYFGPLEIVIGRRREKRWIALFTCLTVRAVHLEVAASLSADSAIQALRRVVARRGQPSVLYTDRGTNFVGAARELKESWAAIEEAMKMELSTRKIRWQFLPPASPHMGGSWERMVRAVKAALGATLKGRTVKEEMLHTLVAEAEAVVNNRPLTHVPVSSDDPVAITPNHLLLGAGVPPAPIEVFDRSDLAARKQWRVVQALADTFWSRWMREYLPTLQKRSKWNKNVPPLKEGDVVVITDPALPRNVWPKGRVVRVFPGRDGQVRSVDVQTKSGVLSRPVARLAVLATTGQGGAAGAPRGVEC